MGNTGDVWGRLKTVHCTQRMAVRSYICQQRQNEITRENTGTHRRETYSVTCKNLCASRLLDIKKFVILLSHIADILQSCSRRMNKSNLEYPGAIKCKNFWRSPQLFPSEFTQPGERCRNSYLLIYFLATCKMHSYMLVYIEQCGI